VPLRRPRPRWRRILRPDPRKRPPKGRIGFWGRFRLFIWSWWVWALAGIWAAVHGDWGWAAGAAAVAVFCHLATPRDEPPSYGLDHEFAIDSEEFLTSIVGATGVPFTRGNRVKVLNNGNEFYPAMLDAITKARESVTIEAYIYWAGDIGLRFARALAERARSGVKVKILLDAVGSSIIGDEILNTLEEGSCEIAWYNPIRWYTIGRVNNRTHRKSLIVDGRIAFTGGAGIADHWMGNAEDPKHWRDVQILIEGAAVMPLQNGFAHNWLETTGELVSGIVYYPPLEPAGSLDVQTILSSPETGASAVRIMYYLSIVCARRSIYIANPYFVPDDAAVDILVDAQRRGVDVKILVSGIHCDNWLARCNSVRLYGRLLEAGVEIYEFNRTMMHSKTMTIDGLWATVGTTNFDNRSFAHNEENNVCVFDRTLAEELARVFSTDLQASDKIDLMAWRHRGAFQRLQELVAALVKDQV
jgi:cardiolipin synthase